MGQKNSKGREAVKIWGLTVFLAAAGIVITFQYVDPPAPRSFVLATGSEQGAYFAFGRQYQERLRESGIEVEVLVTAGSLENLDLLEAGRADVAFVQGGTVEKPAPEQLTGLASLYYEPLWVFLRKGVGAERLSDLAGHRIQVGNAGSGTRAVALQLLKENGVTESNAELIELAQGPAVASLKDGSSDALFLVASPRSTTVCGLMELDGSSITLMNIRRALTYERRYPYLKMLTVSEGLFDLKQNLPDREIRTVSPTAQLVATNDFHPALVPLLVEAAEAIHGTGDLFATPGSFPSSKNLDLPLSKASRRYFVHGRSLLYRMLPFPVAALLDRLKILLLPLLTLLLPLLKIAPPIYRWRIRSKITRWYKVVRGVDQRIRTSAGPEDLARLAEELKRVRQEIDHVEVSPGYMEEYYNLRMHLDRVRELVTR